MTDFQKNIEIAKKLYAGIDSISALEMNQKMNDTEIKLMKRFTSKFGYVQNMNHEDIHNLLNIKTKYLLVLRFGKIALDFNHNLTDNRYYIRCGHFWGYLPQDLTEDNVEYIKQHVKEICTKVIVC